MKTKQELALAIAGMTCDHCVKTVAKTLQGVPGVDEVTVTLKPAQAVVQGTDIDREQLVQAVRQAGFSVAKGGPFNAGASREETCESATGLSKGDPCSADLIVIGGGSAGFAAAIRGHELGAPAFVYTAAYEGNLAAKNALSAEQNPRDYGALPRVIFTDPQVACVGLNEKEAAQSGVEADVAHLDLEHVPRVPAARDTRGFIKLIKERGGDRLLGAHPGAGRRRAGHGSSAGDPPRHQCLRTGGGLPSLPHPGRGPQALRPGVSKGCAKIVLLLCIKDPVPGAVIAVQTFGDLIGYNPHAHILVTDGCFYGNKGMFRVAPPFELKKLEAVPRSEPAPDLIRGRGQASGTRYSRYFWPRERLPRN